jgi:hypothetical protein
LREPHQHHQEAAALVQVPVLFARSVRRALYGERSKQTLWTLIHRLASNSGIQRALRRVLGDLTRAGKLFTVPSFAIADGKTKSFLSAVSGVTEADRKVLLVGDFDDNTKLAARNVAWVQLVTAVDLNVEQLLLSKVIILVGDAVGTLAQRTA